MREMVLAGAMDSAMGDLMTEAINHVYLYLELSHHSIITLDWSSIIV